MKLTIIEMIDELNKVNYQMNALSNKYDCKNTIIDKYLIKKISGTLYFVCYSYPVCHFSYHCLSKRLTRRKFLRIPGLTNPVLIMTQKS